MRRNAFRMRKVNGHLPSDIFSPASGGSVKVSSAMDDIKTQGIIKLNP